MRRDLRSSEAYQEALAFYEQLFGNGIWGASELSIASDLRFLLFSGLQCKRGVEAGPVSDIYRYDFTESSRTLLRAGARLPRLSPSGKVAAFVLDDRLNSRVEICHASTGETLHALENPGLIEQLAWSPDGERLLLLIPGRCADVAGIHGGLELREEGLGPCWLPDMLLPDTEDRRRNCWVWTPDLTTFERLDLRGLNVWEANWLDDRSIVAVASERPGESNWYGSSLVLIDAADGGVSPLYSPVDQIGGPVGSPDGTTIAFIEALCSDRGLVCGTLKTLDVATRSVRALPVARTDISSIAWQSDGSLVYAGVQGLKTAIGTVDIATGLATEIWASATLTCGEWLPAALPFGDTALAIFEGYATPPFIGQIADGRLRAVHKLDGGEAPAGTGRMGCYDWTSQDGLTIEGFLLLPDGAPEKLPLLVDLHGGPIWCHRNRWMARLRAAPLLAQHGCAILFPNPRGSVGRGDTFARLVIGDLGGKDVSDCMAGIDALVVDGIVDAERVGISGSSYGGFMTASLITQSRRFAAAVTISPVANWYSQHFSSQIPVFDTHFLGGDPCQPTGPHFQRSPVFAAGEVTTPTLILAGALDKNTPTGQAIELYGSLVEAGATCAAAVYPQSGHSVRSYPEYVDSVARIIVWLEQHLLPDAIRH
ncbi:prolyl oligopeptidase family serine peptidase [Sphingomonas sp. ASY06-1R]|uniref:prolyl oligopeptidase family serine peptidase n=1 Tax=Sphingomonas sp. ASY06-1R TaxID=3445771 RepID=UPI003FA2846E